MTRLLYFIFFLSGASGLVYEVVWVRLTGLVFGNTTFSIATVLGAFMSGLALGSWWLGSMVDRSERPLRLYGILEILIGISALLVPLAFRAVDTLYWSVGAELSEIAGADTLVRFITSFVIMLVPTFLMGGTLPVLTRFFVQRNEEVGSKVGTLYALNTFGAACGTLVAALVLIPGLGNQLTTVWIASLNVGLGLLAIRLDVKQKVVPESDVEAVETAPRTLAGRQSDRLILLTLAVSGFAAMVYEVAWTRALTAVIGSSTYSFAIMLVTFLVGIAMGSSWASRYRPSVSLRLLGLLQLGIAFGGLVFMIGYLVAPYLLISLIRALFYSFPAVLTIQFIVCSSLMFMATFFMGATFPIAGQLYSSSIQILGRRIGSAYSINTVGAILGSLAAGFFLIPFIGTERTVLVGLFLNSALALFLLAEEKGAFAVARWSSVGLLLTATLAMQGGLFWDPSSMDRGVLIYARQFETRPELLIEEHYTDTDVVFFSEGKNASISVRRGNNYVGLRTNGKVDASNGEDMTTQLLLSYLPGFHHPSPEKVLVIGYGSGVSAGAATVFPEVVRVDCVEIEPAVVEAGPWFDEINRGSYDHPKVNIIYGDARNYLNISPETYDIIISEPSNPWIAGVGSLFTSEFYELAASALNPDGIFAQWIQLYELSPDDLRMVFAEFQRQFPEVSVWDMGVGDLVLLGGHQPFHLDVERMDRIVAADATVRRDFRDQMSLSDPVGILAHYVMSSDQVREFSIGALRNTDDRPLLEFHAPRNLFAQTWDLNTELLSEYKTSLFPPELPDEDRERAYMAIMEPLLSKSEVVFAGQAVRELALIERTSEESLYIAMARLNIDSRQFDEAEGSLLRAEELAVDVDPYGVEREELWGLLRETMGDQGRAMLHYIRVATLDPTRVDVILKLAELNAQMQIWDEGIYWMQQYVQTDPDPIAFYWALLGDYLMSAGRTDEARSAFRTALGFEPYSYLARFGLAEMLEERGESDAAIEHLEFLTVYALDRDAQIYTRLARIYMANQMWADARRVLDKGARIFPTHTDIYKLRRSLGG